VDDPILQNRYKNRRHFTELPPLKTSQKTQPSLKKPCIYMALRAVNFETRPQLRCEKSVKWKKIILMEFE
jgi:hypothetical protein